ncbi:MAG: hypothetical protein MUC87_07975 [Bacteroidia bacterium]|nr:hypothetical protein [Bacteroidia bacterium]
MCLSFRTPSSSAFSELVIEVPKVTVKNYSLLETALAASPGVFVNGYCEERKMFLLLIDRSRQPDNSFLDQLLHNMELEYHVKESCTIAQVRDLCGMGTANQSTTSPQ